MGEEEKARRSERQDGTRKEKQKRSRDERRETATRQKERKEEDQEGPGVGLILYPLQGSGASCALQHLGGNSAGEGCLKHQIRIGHSREKEKFAHKRQGERDTIETPD